MASVIQLTNSDIHRFWSHVDKSGDCWLWTSQLRAGYGIFQVKIGGKWKTVSAHRISYELSAGEEPGKLNVCHRCDTRACIRPDHLFLGTHSDNMRDMMLKDRKGGVLTNDIVSRARIRAENGEYINEIADELNIPRRTLYSAVRSGWDHLGVPPVESPKVKRYRKANKISYEQYLEILEALKKPYRGQGNYLARKYGVNHTMISHIKHGRFVTSAISLHE